MAMTQLTGQNFGNLFNTLGQNSGSQQSNPQFDWWKDTNTSFYNAADPNTQSNIRGFLGGQQINNPTDSFSQWQSKNTDFWNDNPGLQGQMASYIGSNPDYYQWGGVPQGVPQSGGIDFSGLGPSFSQGSSYSSGGGQSHSGLSQLGIDKITPLLGTGEGSLPSLIDDWAQEAMRNYRVSSRDITNTLNQVANQRAAQGIMGGTEAENLRANMMTRLITPTLQNRAQVMGQAAQLKSNAVPALLSLLNETDQSNSNSSSEQRYQQSPDDFRIIASIINGSY